MAGGRSASFRPSAFPGQATKRVSLASCCSWGAWPPIPLRFVLTRLLWARSVRRPGTLARARLFSAAPVGAGGWGGGAGRAPAPLSGGGGPSPLPRGVGAGAPAACGPVGGWGGGGRAAASLLPFWVAACGTQPWPPSCRRRTPFRRARAVGVAVPPRGGGGVRGGPWTAPPGAPADLNPPSALPAWAVVTGGSCGARPPYCSGARVAQARWFGLAPRPRPPREQVQPHPPPPRRGPFWGGGASPRLRGGGGPLLWLPSWGPAGGGAGGAAPPPRRASACLPLPPACSSGVYSCRGGCRAAAGVAAALFAPSWASPARRRPAAGRACGRLPRPWCPRTPGAAASSGGVWGRRFFGLPPSALGFEWEGGRGSGGRPLVPWRRLLTAGGGGGMAVQAPGASLRLGGRTLPPPPST